MALTDYLIDSDSLVTSGFAGTGTTRTGAYDNPVAGNNVIRGTLTTTPVAICGVGNLGNVGTYRVKARVFPVIATSIATDMKVRLSWKEGDGPLRANDYVTCPAGTAAFSEVDLGLISIPATALGTQRWTGQIEAYSTTSGDTLDVDYVLLIPTARYGKARAPAMITTPTTFSARDDFSQTAGALSGKTLLAGGTWSTVGADATDLAVEVTGHTAVRATTADSSGKFAIAGATTFTDVVAQVDFQYTGTVTTSPFLSLVCRYVDASNYVWGLVQPSSTGVVAILNTVVGGLSAGGFTPVAVPVTAGTFWSMRLQVDATGAAHFAVFPKGTTPSSWTVEATNAAMAAGGTLASGKVGFFDKYTGAAVITRNYDNFTAWVPSVDAVVFSGRTAEIRSDSAIRQDSTGTYYGPISTYRGSRFFVPAAGAAGRTTDIVVKVRRNDVDVLADDQIADSTTVSVSYTPRYLVAPR